MTDPSVLLNPSRAAGRLEHVLSQMLAGVARALLEPSASDAEAAGVLSELLRVLRLHDGLRAGRLPRREEFRPKSPALADLESALSAAVRQFRAAAHATASPNALPGGLEKRFGRVGSGLQMGASSVPNDEITLDAAGGLMGLSAERVRQLVKAGALDGWQEAYGHREWHVIRASVIAYLEQRGGRDGPGGGDGQRRQVA